MVVEMQNLGGALRVRDLLLKPEGRIGRVGYCVGALALIVWSVLVALIPTVGDALALVFTWGWICILSRRLHDLGVSGWWQIPFHLTLPVSFADAFGVDIFNPTVASVAAPFLVAQALCLIALAVIPGQAGGNRYGPPASDVGSRW